MVQTILDTYLGGWSVFILLGGEKLPMSILARTLIAHILLGVLGLLLLGLHLRVVHFIGSSLNRFYTWVTLDRPLWLPNELVKETYLLFSYFFFFFYFTKSRLAGGALTQVCINFTTAAQLIETICRLLLNRNGIFEFFTLCLLVPVLF
jgi:hypothetical protein